MKIRTKIPEIHRFCDVGWAAYLLGIETSDQMMRDPLQGNLFENLIVNELMKSRYNQVSACTMAQAILMECSFKHCGFSLVSLDGCRLQNVRFEDCKLVGLEFHKCDKTFFCVTFQQSILMACNFSELKMKKTSFSHSKLKECYFNSTQLLESNFQQTDLAGTLFHHCDLSKTDFRGAINYAIDPQTNNLKKAVFSSPEVLALLSFFDIKIE